TANGGAPGAGAAEMDDPTGGMAGAAVVDAPSDPSDMDLGPSQGAAGAPSMEQAGASAPGLDPSMGAAGSAVDPFDPNAGGGSSSGADPNGPCVDLNLF